LIGRGTASATDFTYADGAWNTTERQFMGFRTVTATLPANAGETAVRVDRWKSRKISPRIGIFGHTYWLLSQPLS
jgi:hypothetical protein